MSKAKISIIIPCYNQEKYLDECLASVYHQTFTEWECIIVNDGSTDHSEIIAREWQKKDRRFKYFKTDNKGVSAARNFGIQNSSGEWLLPLDADDKISEDYLQIASENFSGYDVIYCDAEYFGAKSGKMILPDFDRNTLLFENQLFCTSFFKKSDFLLIKGYDETMHKGFEDWEFWLQLIKAKPHLKVCKINRTLFHYRIKEKSRNTEAMQLYDLDVKKYFFTKHQDLYLENISSITKILLENRKLKQKNEHLLQILGSKRYRFVDKIFNIFKR